MVFRSTWLRVLLSMALILNGSAIAMPSMHGGIDAAAGIFPSTSAHEHIAAQPSCHDAPSMAVVEKPGSDVANLPVDSSKGSTPGCCEHGKCSCVCAHAAATLPAFARMEATVSHGPITRPVEVRHVAPVLSLLSRPPIV